MVVLAVSIGVLLFATIAHAGVDVSGPITLQGLYFKAVEWWGQGEPPGCESVSLETVLAIEGNLDANGAAWPATQFGPECRIEIITANTKRCALVETMRHEVGHLLGYGHSSNPGMVMYPTNDQQEPVCTRSELAFYRNWLGKASALCSKHRHRAHAHAECAIRVRLIRRETRRWAAKAGQIQPSEGRP